MGGISKVRGKVLDEQGRPIAGATVKLHNTEAQIERVATTAPDGSFLFSMMPAGPYAATVSAEGYQPQVLTFRLGENEVVPLSVALGPGDVIAEEIVLSGGELSARDLRRMEAEQRRQEE